MSSKPPHDTLVELLRYSGYLTYGQSVNVATMMEVILNGGTVEQAKTTLDAAKADDDAFRQETEQP